MLCMLCVNVVTFVSIFNFSLLTDHDLLLFSENVVNVREVGPDWVSLSWKRPDNQMKPPPIVTYKVEAWICGEGAYWVEVR